MRQLKFRAWDSENSKMVDVDSIDFLKNEYWSGAEEWNLHPSTIMQFTGLTDKNGEDIYEGDIGKDRRDSIWKISFGEKNTASFGATCISDTGAHDELYPQVMHFAWVVMHDFEVIGNIHENPELLK